MPNCQNLAVIWDMDGTLVDTAELHFQAWVQLARELSKPFSRADFAATFGQRNPEILRQLFNPGYTEQEVAGLGERKEIFYREAARKGVELLPGVGALLEVLHGGGFKQAIGSSAPFANLELILSLTHSERFFDVVVSMEDTERGKPDPQVFLVAAAKLKVDPPGCLVVEDAPAGIQAAKAAGMKCIAVSFIGHHSNATLFEAGADRVVSSLADVSVDSVRALILHTSN